MKLINENTGLSIGLVIALIGGLFWLTNLWAKADTTAQAVIRIEANQQKYTDHLMMINQRLSKIEGRLGVNRRDN